MNNLNSLRLCTEKSLSIGDKIALKEAFNIEHFHNKSIELFSSGPTHGSGGISTVSGSSGGISTVSGTSGGISTISGSSNSGKNINNTTIIPTIQKIFNIANYSALSNEYKTYVSVKDYNNGIDNLNNLKNTYGLQKAIDIYNSMGFVYLSILPTNVLNSFLTSLPSITPSIIKNSNVYLSDGEPRPTYLGGKQIDLFINDSLSYTFKDNTPVGIGTDMQLYLPGSTINLPQNGILTPSPYAVGLSTLLSTQNQIKYNTTKINENKTNENKTNENKTNENKTTQAQLKIIQDQLKTIQDQEQTETPSSSYGGGGGGELNKSTPSSSSSSSYGGGGGGGKLSSGVTNSPYIWNNEPEVIKSFQNKYKIVFDNLNIWDEDNDYDLRQLIDNNMSINEIATKFGVSKNVIQDRINFINKENFTVSCPTGWSGCKIKGLIGVLNSTDNFTYIKNGIVEEDYSKEVENIVSPIFGTEGGLSSIYSGYDNKFKIPVVLNNAFGTPQKNYLQLLPDRIFKNNNKNDTVNWDNTNKSRLLELHYKGTDILDISNIFGTSPENIKKQLKTMGLTIVEKFTRRKVELPIPLVEKYTRNRSKLYSKLRYYIKNNIIILKDPNLNIVDSVMSRQFFTNKFTISFGNIDNFVWSDLNTLETMRDENYNLIPIDPIEYEIRKLKDPRDAIKKVVRERIEPFVNIIFEFLDYDDPINEAVIRIGFKPKEGCWSLLGIDHFFSLDELTVNLGWLDSGTIMHEFGHILGMIHEHQVPMGKTINWNEPLVYEWAQKTLGWDKQTTYINILKKTEKNQVNATNFDPKSIMLYFFPAILTLDNIGCHQNMRLNSECIKFFISIVPGKNVDYIKFLKDVYNEDIVENTKLPPLAELSYPKGGKGSELTVIKNSTPTVQPDLNLNIFRLCLLMLIFLLEIIIIYYIIKLIFYYY